MGYILLEGGAEFVGRMAESDRQAILLAGGPDVPIALSLRPRHRIIITSGPAVMVSAGFGGWVQQMYRQCRCDGTL